MRNELPVERFFRHGEFAGHQKGIAAQEVGEKFSGSERIHAIQTLEGQLQIAMLSVQIRQLEMKERIGRVLFHFRGQRSNALVISAVRKNRSGLEQEQQDAPRQKRAATERRGYSDEGCYRTAHCFRIVNVSGVVPFSRMKVASRRFPFTSRTSEPRLSNDMKCAG